MQYMMLFYSNEAGFAQMHEAQLTTMTAAFTAYTEALKTAGVWMAGDRLQPIANATTVRGPGDEVSIHDGPFAETKEQLGGYYLIEAPDLDAALGWAKRSPAVQSGMGAVEVRPVFALPAG